MGRPRLVGRVLCAVLPVLTWTAAAPAHAWTEANVRSASADVVVSPSGEAAVELRLGVHVRGGWLEALEVAGLDEDMALDEASPPVFLSEEGERFTPRFRAREGGSVWLQFSRRDAPRRGEYTAVVRYTTQLGHRMTEPVEGDRVRVSWTLPGWRSGLDGVSIRLTVPPGAVEAAGEMPLVSVDREKEETDGHTVFAWRRAHLPRTIPWTVSVDVPGHYMAEELRGVMAAPEAPDPAPVASVADPEPARAPWLFCVLFGLMALVKQVAFDLECARRRVVPRPLVPLPHLAIRVMLLLLCVLGAGRLLEEGSPLSLALFGLALLLSAQRTVHVLRASRAGRFRPVTPADRRSARRELLLSRLSPLAFTDGTAPAGLLVLLGVVWAVGVAHRLDAAPEAGTVHVGHLLWLLLPLSLTGTRHALPPSVAASLTALEDLARGFAPPLDGPAMAVASLVHEAADGTLQEARLRLLPAAPPEGLDRLDMTWSGVPRAGGVVAEPALLVRTRAGSAADELAAGAAPLPPLPGPGGQHVRVVPAPRGMADVLPVARALLAPEAPVDATAPRRQRPVSVGLSATTRPSFP